MKRACEADKSVGDSDFCCLGKVVICTVVLFSLSRCPRLIVVSGMKYNVSSGHLVGTGCKGSAGRREKSNHQGLWEDANCVGVTIVRNKFNKLCHVSCHSAIGVGMFYMGRRDSDPAFNGEARGGQRVVYDSRWRGCFLILGGFFWCNVSGVCMVFVAKCMLNCGGCSVRPVQALEELWRGGKDAFGL